MFRGRGTLSGRLRLAAPANPNRVHDLCHTGRLEGDGFRHLALDIRVDQTIQIDHMIQSLHIEQIGGFQCQVLANAEGCQEDRMALSPWSSIEVARQERNA